MAAGIERLKALTISRKMKRGYHADGGGLYLQVSATGAKSWVYRFRVRAGSPDAGRLREMGLGSFDTISLTEARDAARSCRKQLQDGLDPIRARHQGRMAAIADDARAMTFSQCAEAYIAIHRPAWKNKKHAQQWTSTLTAYVKPVLGNRLVKEIDTDLIMKVLEPIWHAKRETASRLRGRMESILDWATARGYREGENPARWKGKIDMLLPARSKTSKVKHHPALPYNDLPDFMNALRAQPGIAASALEFAILTAARTSEVLGAGWSEINFETKIWTVPEARMKGGREHRVPLAQRAITILRQLEKVKCGDAIFPNLQTGQQLSNMAMLSVLKRMARSDLTTHGFRSTFRDWAADKTEAAAEVAEMSLAHAVGNAVEAAYRRSDLYEKRRQLMANWADYCSSAVARTVVPFVAGR